MSEHHMTAKNLKTGYDSRIIIDGADLEIPVGKISVIFGANGCGKSTLLKTFCRLNPVLGGSVCLDGKSIQDYVPREFACTVGLMPQSPLVPEGITVYDLVSRGRFPYRKFMKGLDSADFEAINDALEMMEITDMADRPVEQLSGGQRQRVWIALALAQQTDILFLDEPTTFLDIAYQVEILDLLTDLNQKRGITIVMVLHDINLSAKYADYLFAVKNGKLAASGTPDEVITESLIHEIYGLNCCVQKDPVSGSPFMIPIGRYHNGTQE